MSPTIFWYIFKDLLRIFLLTALALAGIMSFAGLLRPLTQHGLDGSQVARMLGYFLPAMTTYSLPVAALFATTLVYGRLSGDNEVTACRAAGLSHWMISLPAVVLGLCITLLSALLLSFIVPAAMLQVERVIYSNLAQLVANRIQRTHAIEFEQEDTKLTVWAQGAAMLPTADGTQAVQLQDVLIATYERQRVGERRLEVPVDFYVARSATAFIDPGRGDEPVLLRVALDGGTKFARDTASRGENALDVSIGSTQFGPWPLEPRVRENSKFMDMRRLQHLLQYPEQSRRIGRLVSQFVRADMRDTYLNRLALQFNESSDEVRFDAGTETYLLRRGTAPAEVRRDGLVLSAEPGTPPLQFAQLKPDGSGLRGTAQHATLRVWPDLADETLTVTVELRGAVVTVDGQSSPRGDGFQRTFVVPMPDAIRQLKHKRVGDYAAGTDLSGDQQRRLYRDKLKLYNSLMSEIHARLSFAISCLILVIVGCCLGLMFQSGNFLSAFAVSVIPALICIVLIVSGQHTAENIPWNVGRGFRDPLPLGLALIWSGNAAVAVLAGGLMWRLSRQ
jgi:lipopolysaccharide export LptBFGC system permease protein LptF